MIALVVLGCAEAPDEIPRDEFARWTADVVCDRSRECMRGEYDREFYGHDDCTATVEMLYDALADSFEDLGCDYAAGRAGSAVAEIDAMTCEEIYEGELEEALSDVWDGCAGYPTEPYTYYEYYKF